ncbi:MAG TPA: hypothetical protein VD884_05960 [Ohtaekwangia sp.]|nr:hypothetical protein [Ohtaekwangia sp.]
MDEKGLKTLLYNNGHVFYITSAFPPVPGGSCVLNQNLLKAFDPESFTVVTIDSPLNKVEVEKTIKVERVLYSKPELGKYNYWLMRLQIRNAIRKVKSLAKEKNVKLIIGAYPNLIMLKIAYEVAKQLKIPFVAYLHDTIAESLAGSPQQKLSSKVQSDVFTHSRKIFVMSEGMEDLYRKKYSLETIALQHTYMESIPTEVPIPKVDKIFWGGAVYDINKNAIRTIAKISERLQWEFELATNTSKGNLETFGIIGNTVKITFYSSRTEYLAAVKDSSILLLALDSPNQTRVHEDEISTIFPTKTPEYLAAGIPILVLCPSHYFLARFFKKYSCGLVVDPKDYEGIEKAILLLRSRPVEIVDMQKNALNVARTVFGLKQVADKLKVQLESIPEKS